MIEKNVDTFKINLNSFFHKLHFFISFNLKTQKNLVKRPDNGIE